MTIFFDSRDTKDFYDEVFGRLAVWVSGDNYRIYPITVVQARYGGSYEGAPWLAFPCYSDQIDRMCDGWDQSDIECMVFWEKANEKNWLIGKGVDPNSAVQDLTDKMLARAGIT